MNSQVKLIAQAQRFASSEGSDAHRVSDDNSFEVVEVEGDNSGEPSSNQTLQTTANTAEHPTGNLNNAPLELLQEQSSVYLARFMHSVVTARDLQSSDQSQHPKQQKSKDPLRRNTLSDNDLGRAFSSGEQMSSCQAQIQDNTTDGTEIQESLTYLQILKRLRQVQSSGPATIQGTSDQASNAKQQKRLFPFSTKLFVHSINPRLNSLVLAEAWTFEFVPTVPPSEKSDSQSSSSRSKGSFSLSPRLTTTTGQIFEIDENHFQVQPNDVRQNQATKFVDRLTALARSLPLSYLLAGNSQFLSMSKLDKQSEWRAKTKLSPLDYSTDLFEFGKVYVKVEYIPSDIDLKFQLSQENEQRKSFSFGNLFGATQNSVMPSRDRRYSEQAPQIENRAQNLMFKEELKTEIRPNQQTINQEQLRLKLRHNLSDLHQKGSEDSSIQKSGRSSFSGYGLFGKLADGIQNMMLGSQSKTSGERTSITSATARPPIVSEPMNLQGPIFTQSPTGADNCRSHFGSIKQPLQHASTLQYADSKTGNQPLQRPRANTLNDAKINLNNFPSDVVRSSLPENSQLLTSQINPQEKIKFVSVTDDGVVRELSSQSSIDSIDIIDDQDDSTAVNQDETKDIIDKVSNLILQDQLAQSQVSVTAEASQQHITLSTKSGTSHEKLSALSSTLSQMLKQAEKAVSRTDLQESYLHVTREINKESFDKELQSEYHAILKVQRALKRAKTSPATKV